jgi:hypothetical protein
MAELAGIDLSSNDVANVNLNRIVDEAVNIMLANEFNLGRNEPVGIIDFRSGVILGGDIARGGDKTAYNGKDWELK